MKKIKWILLAILVLVTVCLMSLFNGDKSDDKNTPSSGNVEQSSDEEIVFPEEKLPEYKSDATGEGVNKSSDKEVYTEDENNKKSEAAEEASSTVNDKEVKENEDNNENNQNVDESDVTEEKSEITSGKPIVLPEIQF